MTGFLAEHGLTIWHLWGAIAAVALVLGLMYVLGALVDPIGGRYIGSVGDMARGGCVLMILCVIGFVGFAVLVWAWRVLFGD